MSTPEYGFCECGSALGGRSDRQFCSSACRQFAYRERVRLAKLDRKFWAAMAGLANVIGVSLEDIVRGSRNAAAANSRNAQAV